MVNALTDAQLEKPVTRSASWDSYQCLGFDQFTIMENLRFQLKAISDFVNVLIVLFPGSSHIIKYSRIFYLTELRFDFKCSRIFPLTEPNQGLILSCPPF